MKNRANAWLVSRVLVITALAFTLAACKEETGASADQIGHAVALQLPVGLEVKSAETVASENTGTTVEPLWRARTNVALEYTQDYYEQVDTLLEKAVVERSAAKGDVIEGMVISSATPRGESWDITLDEFSFPEVSGEAASSFGVAGFVLEGSSEHTALAAQKEEQDRKAAEEKARRDAERAEAQRKAAEEAGRQAEIRRAEQEKREAALKAERAAKIAALRKDLTGTWVSVSPGQYNGQIEPAKNGGLYAVQVTIPAGDNPIGKGEITFYDFNNPIDEAVAPMDFQIDENGDFMGIRLAYELKHPGFDTSFSDTVWRNLTPDGALSHGDRNGSWRYQLEKDGPALARRKVQVDGFKALVAKYNTPLGNTSMQNLGLGDNTYANFILRGDQSGDIWGDGIYYRNSWLPTAAVHADILQHNQWGVVKVTLRRHDDRQSFQSAKKNNVTSGRNSSNWTYTLELVEALPPPN